MQNVSFSKLLGMIFCIVLVVGLLFIGIAKYANYEKPHGGNFVLNDATGEWTFTKHNKDLNLLYFGYTHCPDVCPMTLSFFNQAYKKLSPEDQARVQFIFVSVDADHDTPEIADHYANQFNPNFKGLSGTKSQVDQVVNLFGSSYVVEKAPATHLGYSVAHSDKIYFLNKKGIVLTEVRPENNADYLKQQIKENL